MRLSYLVYFQEADFEPTIIAGFFFDEDAANFCERETIDCDRAPEFVSYGFSDGEIEGRLDAEFLTGLFASIDPCRATPCGDPYCEVHPS